MVEFGEERSSKVNNRDTYPVRMTCANCQHHWNGEIPKGKDKIGEFVIDQICPKCGNENTSISL